MVWGTIECGGSLGVAQVDIQISPPSESFWESQMARFPSVCYAESSGAVQFSPISVIESQDCRNGPLKIQPRGKVRAQGQGRSYALAVW